MRGERSHHPEVPCKSGACSSVEEQRPSKPRVGGSNPPRRNAGRGGSRVQVKRPGVIGPRSPVQKQRFVGVALALTAVAICVLPGTAGAKKSGVGEFRLTGRLQAHTNLTSRAAIEPKLQYQLGVLARTGAARRSREAERLGVSVRGGSVRVILQTRGRPDLRGLAAAGARVEGRAGALVQATVPMGALRRVTGLRGIRFVRLPSYQEPDAIPGEEINATNASSSHAKGWTGKNVRVAIIDSGFGGYVVRGLEGELPSNVVTADFCDRRFETNTNHGTAVAEIVHEMAPNAQLFLICFDTDVGFAQAEAYAKSNRVHIITHSGSTFNNGRGDGAALPGSEGAIVTDARKAGILWINSAGNSAQRHWSGTFTDADADGNHDFVPGSEGNGFTLTRNEDVCVFLKWDEWPVGASDFDLYLLNGSGIPVAVSQTRQTGSQPPTEQVCYTNTGATAPFFAAIGAINAVGAPRFDIFVRNIDPPLQFLSPDSSVGDPGASAFAFTAGAICWQTNELEPYSGRGPTIDGRIKPDVAGQDSNSGATYGEFTACGQSGFTGTSASAPAVAGAAALVKEQNPKFTADQLQAFLETNAQDLGDPGKDNLFGAGKLFLPTPLGPGPTTADTIKPQVKALRSKGVRGKQVRLYSRASDDSGEVRIVDTIKRGARALGRVRTGFSKTAAGRTYYVPWKVPASVSGSLKHCVQAFDRTGNKSTVSCAALAIAKK
jgi:subtilisin family serine protease